MENVLISACLLGIACRYDGKSKQKFTYDELASLKKRYNLIPVCPEIYGGLPTPRTESERISSRVMMKDGTDVTENYKRGALLTLELARIFDCKLAILKERSPSCGNNEIYDGTFLGILKDGMGVTAELLTENGITVISEDEIKMLLEG